MHNESNISIIDKESRQILDTEHSLKSTTMSTDIIAKHNSLAVVKDTMLFGLRSFIVAISYFGIGEIMSAIGPEEGAASSITITYQGIIIGTGSGFIMGIGSEMSAAQGKGESRDIILSIARMGFFESISLGLLGGALCLSARLWLPLVLSDKDVATAAIDYLTTYAGAPMVEFLMLYFGQLVFRMEKNALFALVTSSVYRLTVIPLAYFLGITLNMGAKGVGLASTISGTINVFISSPWFLKKEYNGIAKFSGNTLTDNASTLCRILKPGKLLSLQRISEWGNLFIIFQIIGSWSSEELLAAQPSLLALTLTGQLVQGFSLAGMLIVIERAKTLQKLLDSPTLFTENDNHINLTKLKKQSSSMLLSVKKSFLLSNLSGLFVNGILVATLYLSSDYIINFLMPNGTSDVIKHKAHTYLLINLAFTFPDTVRIISSNPLLAWDDLTFPVLCSLVSMSAVGVPVGVAIAYYFNKNIIPIFIARGAAIIFSSIANLYRAIGHIKKNSEDVENIDAELELITPSSDNSEDTPLLRKNFSFFDSLCFFGRKPVTELQNISINQELDEVENTASCCAIS